MAVPNRANATNTVGPSLAGTVNYLGAGLGSFYLKGRLALWQRENLEHWRDRRLRWLVKWAYRKSPFYRQLYESAGVKIDSFEIEDLPTVNRQMLMENFDQVLTQPGITRREVEAFCEAPKASRGGSGYFRGRYLPIKSSGSSGERGLFLFDKTYFRSSLIEGW